MRKKIYTKPLLTVVPEHLHEMVLRLTEEKEVSVAEFLREALEMKLKAEGFDPDEKGGSANGLLQRA